MRGWRGRGGAGLRAKRARKMFILFISVPTPYPVKSSVLHWRPVFSKFCPRVHPSNKKYEGCEKSRVLAVLLKPLKRKKYYFVLLRGYFVSPHRILQIKYVDVDIFKISEEWEMSEESKKNFCQGFKLPCSSLCIIGIICRQLILCPSNDLSLRVSFSTCFNVWVVAWSQSKGLWLINLKRST